MSQICCAVDDSKSSPRRTWVIAMLPSSTGNGQLIGIHIIGPANDEVTAGARQIVLLPAVNGVGKGNRLLRYVDAPRWFLGHTAALIFTEP